MTDILDLLVEIDGSEVHHTIGTVFHGDRWKSEFIYRIGFTTCGRHFGSADTIVEKSTRRLCANCKRITERAIAKLEAERISDLGVEASAVLRV